jgi:predicted XRE-type DNA-binding protein
MQGQVSLFSLDWHKNTKGMISEAEEEEVFLEKVKHVKYYRIKDNKKNCYFSVNSFITHRLKKNIFELIGLAVDIDFKEAVNFEYIIRLLEDQEWNFNIPKPSYINFSGHGLHVYWRYEDPIPARTKNNELKNKLIYLHEKINKTFAKVLQDYGGDLQATDITRLLRDTNTYNGDELVRTIRDYQISYSLEELQQWLHQIKEKPKKIKKSISSLFYIRNYYTLHMARLEDIFTLAEIRNYDCKGHRELMSFLVRYYSYITCGEPEKAKEVMLELNNKFIEPLSEYRLIVDTKSAEKAVEKYLLSKEKGYNYSNERLIDILNIVPEEEVFLKSIISTKEKYKRKNTKRNTARRNEQGLTVREQEKKDKIKRIIELKEQGLKQIEIAEKLGIDKGLVSRYLKENKKVD